MGNEVKIKLTDAQKAKIRQATGRDLPEIRVESFGASPAVSAPAASSSLKATRAMRAAKSMRAAKAHARREVDARRPRPCAPRSRCAPPRRCAPRSRCAPPRRCAPAKSMRAAKAMRAGEVDARSPRRCALGGGKSMRAAQGDARLPRRCKRLPLGDPETPRASGAFPFHHQMTVCTQWPSTRRCATRKDFVAERDLGVAGHAGQARPVRVVEDDDRVEALGPLGGPQGGLRPVRGARQVARRRADLDDRAVEDVSGARAQLHARRARPGAGTASSRSLTGISAFSRAQSPIVAIGAPAGQEPSLEVLHAGRQDASLDRTADGQALAPGLVPQHGDLRGGLAALGLEDARGVAGLAHPAGLLAQGARARPRCRRGLDDGGRAGERGHDRALLRRARLRARATSTIVPSSGASRRTSVQGRRTASRVDRPRRPRDREDQQQRRPRRRAGTSATRRDMISSFLSR